MVDLKFPTDNVLDVPVLDFQLQAEAVHMPLLAWGSIKRGKRINRGTWEFYRDDYKFKKIWEQPEVLLATECNAAVEPNFSIFPQTPFAVALELTYKKRWLARYWQAHGVQIFVDMNVAEEFAELNLVGVPRGWRAYATRAYAERLDDLDREYAHARERAGCDPLFLVVGGGKAGEERCQERGWTHGDSHREWVAKEGIERIRLWREGQDPGKLPEREQGCALGIDDRQRVLPIFDEEDHG